MLSAAGMRLQSKAREHVSDVLYLAMNSMMEGDYHAAILYAESAINVMQDMVKAEEV